MNVFNPLLSEAGIAPTKMVGSCLIFSTWCLFPLMCQKVKTYLTFKSYKKSLQRSITVCIVYQFSLLDDLQIQVRNHASVLSLTKKSKSLRMKGYSSICVIMSTYMSINKQEKRKNKTCTWINYSNEDSSGTEMGRNLTLKLCKKCKIAPPLIQPHGCNSNLRMVFYKWDFFLL